MKLRTGLAVLADIMQGFEQLFHSDNELATGLEVAYEAVDFVADLRPFFGVQIFKPL